MSMLPYRYGYSAFRAGGYRAACARRFWLNVAVAFLTVLVIVMRVWPSIRYATANGSPAMSKIQNSAYYPNCAAVRAAGAAPIYLGQPAYRPQLDADRDGIACEQYPT
jgi:hypothetical protein